VSAGQMTQDLLMPDADPFSAQPLVWKNTC
jgi:hypothetical protein